MHQSLTVLSLWPSNDKLLFCDAIYISPYFYAIIEPSAVVNLYFGLFTRDKEGSLMNTERRREHRRNTVSARSLYRAE